MQLYDLSYQPHALLLQNIHNISRSLYVYLMRHDFFKLYQQFLTMSVMIYRLFNLATYMLGQKFGNQRVLEVGSAFIKLVRDLKFYNIEEQDYYFGQVEWSQRRDMLWSRPKSFRCLTWEFDL